MNNRKRKTGNYLRTDPKAARRVSTSSVKVERHRSDSLVRWVACGTDSQKSHASGIFRYGRENPSCPGGSSISLEIKENIIYGTQLIAYRASEKARAGADRLLLCIGRRRLSP